MRRLLVVLLAGVAGLLVAATPRAHVPAPRPHAVTLVSYVPKRVEALEWAYSQRGKPYEWGGTGPYGYDCSGLVQTAYRKVGIYLPRTTYGMLAKALLQRVYWPAPGDLAFYGSGHVELFVWIGPYRLHGATFGAHDPGSRVGFSGWAAAWGWYPTMYFHVRGAG